MQTNANASMTMDDTAEADDPRADVSELQLERPQNGALLKLARSPGPKTLAQAASLIGALRMT